MVHDDEPVGLDGLQVKFDDEQILKATRVRTGGSSRAPAPGSGHEGLRALGKAAGGTRSGRG